MAHEVDSVEAQWGRTLQPQCEGTWEEEERPGSGPASPSAPGLPCSLSRLVSSNFHFLLNSKRFHSEKISKAESEIEVFCEDIIEPKVDPGLCLTDHGNFHMYTSIDP